jgi:DNA-binding XRE family transcriptional regulator
MIALTESPPEIETTLGLFLRTLRGRIPSNSATIGPVRRLPARHGRRVTQEEIAEAVGVSRNWYRRLETDAGVHASTKLLVRLARTFALTADERGTLFTLALPELWQLDVARSPMVS